jgi:hypothetical protein
MEYTYNDGLHPGGRNSRLYLAKGAETVKFEGDNIPGFVAIVSSSYEQRGKWSNCSYLLTLAPGVRPLYFLAPLHNKWGNEYKSWGEMAAKLQLPVPTLKEVVKKEYPPTFNRLEALEVFCGEVEDEATDVEVVIVSFGGPTRRQVAYGFRDEEKSAKASDGTIVTITPSHTEYGWNWREPVLVAPEGAKILSCQHTPGMKGGYYAVEVAVPLSAS